MCPLRTICHRFLIRSPKSASSNSTRIIAKITERGGIVLGGTRPPLTQFLSIPSLKFYKRTSLKISTKALRILLAHLSSSQSGRKTVWFYIKFQRRARKERFFLSSVQALQRQDQRKVGSRENLRGSSMHMKTRRFDTKSGAF